jgi:serine/threonine protein kinase
MRDSNNVRAAIRCPGHSTFAVVREAESGGIEHFFTFAYRVCHSVFSLIYNNSLFPIGFECDAAFARDEMNADNPGAIQFKLGDLGVAKLFTEIDATNTRALWMLPPEVLDPSEFGPLDHRIDIYHCGLLFLHLLHGRELRFTPNEIREGKPRELALQLPVPLNFALEKALRRHVAYRTASAMELWRDLNSPEPPSQPQPEQLELK